MWISFSGGIRPAARALTAFALGAGLLAAIPAAAPAQPALIPVRISFNRHFITYVALDDAIDKGYFKAAGLDLQITNYQTSANSQLPSLARGDLDITVVVPGPALFNQFNEGFDARIVASVDEAHPGYLDGSVLVVRKDLAGTIKKPADLAGRNVDGAFNGSPIALLTLQTIEAGGLTPDKVNFTTKESAVSDQLAALTNKVVDVQGTTEPTATVMQTQGVGNKWISYRDVMPGYQEAYWGVSAGFAKDHPDAIVKFLQAYLKGAADVNRSGGKLTPDLVAIMSKWTEIPPDVIQAMGATPYFGQAGAINPKTLDGVQQFWMKLGLVKTPVPVEKIIDPQFLAQAKAGK
jgi:NitT/TauT family transport system substrate-binding protein